MPAFHEWMWSVRSAELAWSSNKRYWKYSLILDNNRKLEKAKSQKESGGACLSSVLLFLKPKPNNVEKCVLLHFQDRLLGKVSVSRIC